MFSRETYASRRAELRNRVGSGLIILPANTQSSMNYKDNWYPFRQDSSFLYYCGLDIPDLILLIDADTGIDILFGTDAGIDDIVWQGPQPSIAELADRCLVEKSAALTSLPGYIQGKRVIHYLPPYRPEQKDNLADLLGIATSAVTEGASRKLINAIVSMRSVKTAEEVFEIEKAVNTTNAMQMEALTTTRAGETEAAVAGRLQSIAIAAGGNLAFPTILTTRGETLHIHYTNNKIEPGKLLLCDCGAENAMRYPGDLTRTFPVDKHFTTIQKEVYQVVLNAQQQAAEALKPGETFLDIHLLACEKLVDGLKDLGLMKGNSKEAVNNQAHTLFFQCGLGHMLGLDIHDMENLGEQYVGYDETMTKSKIFGLKSLRLARKMEPGFVLTVEPGIYFIPALIDIWKAEQKLSDFINYDRLEQFRNFGGIRIEEDFLITTSGARLLGDPIAKSVTEIENLRQSAQ
jgi:Xaa-Pro aminopeptidase